MLMYNYDISYIFVELQDFKYDPSQENLNQTQLLLFDKTIFFRKLSNVALITHKMRKEY